MNYKHGMKGTRLYRIWQAMKTRCFNPNFPRFNDYGGRGISVCDEWKDDFQAFHCWSILNGYQENLTIDRIDNDGNYEPINCRWTTNEVQANNSRQCNFIEFNGETHNLTEWAEILNIPRYVLSNRIHAYGWTVERAFKTKAQKKPRKAVNKV